MKRNTIKWRIFKYNLVVIFMLIILITIIFNIAIRFYIEKDIVGQLNKIAESTENVALQHGPDFFQDPTKAPPPQPHNDNGLFRYYLMLDHSLKEPLTVLNADYILLDSDKSVFSPYEEQPITYSPDLLKKVTDEIDNENNNKGYLNFHLSDTEYIAIIKPVLDKNSFGLGWIVIYSSLQKLNELQIVVNVILFAIIIFSTLIIIVFSSLIAKKISAPFSSLTGHIRSIAERNFDTKIHIPVDDELREFVNNINILSEKLEIYDKAQKTFLQNVSHEFRTPLMSIQSYAEGIKYEVVDNSTAAEVIIEESKRMTNLVEDLLYLSRLDAIEENYHYQNLNLIELVNNCIQRMNAIAVRNNIKIISNNSIDLVNIYGDEEKLSRAITNIISNCIRYAESTVFIKYSMENKAKIKLIMSDDGPGFETSELPNIFERFYKGKKGNFGLGLSISKNVIDKHHGSINAVTSDKGALFIIELPIILI